MTLATLAAETNWRVWGTQQISTGFVSWQCYSSGRQPNFAALNTGRHLYSAGQPSCWASAHILVYNVFLLSTGHHVSTVVQPGSTCADGICPNSATSSTLRTSMMTASFRCRRCSTFSDVTFTIPGISVTRTSITRLSNS